jgi:hypothetical protein
MTEQMDWSLWDMLWHSIGMNRSNYRRTLSWWLDDDNHRNHFAADPQGTDMADLNALISFGYMKRGRAIPGGLVYYHVTAKGIETARSEAHKTKFNQREWIPAGDGTGRHKKRDTVAGDPRP